MTHAVRSRLRACASDAVGRILSITSWKSAEHEVNPNDHKGLVHPMSLRSAPPANDSFVGRTDRRLVE